MEKYQNNKEEFDLGAFLFIQDCLNNNEKINESNYETIDYDELEEEDEDDND